MTPDPSPRVAPEVREAVVRLLEAERDWSRAYDAWSHAPLARRDALHHRLEDAEHRVEDAQRAAIDLQPDDAS